MGLAPPPELLTLQQDLPRRAFAFGTNEEKVESFMEWLRENDSIEILDLFPGQERAVVGSVRYANVYIDSAYKKGIRLAETEMQKRGIKPSRLPADADITIDALFNRPIHADKVAQIYQRVYSDLRNITDEMEQQISEVLAQSLADGLGPRETARILQDRIHKTGGTLALDFTTEKGIKFKMRARNRAIILARTEIIRAHHVATINTYREAGVEGVRVLAEWRTAGDERVCERCEALEGQIFTLDEIEGLIPLHAQCRCVALPARITMVERARADGTINPPIPPAPDGSPVENNTLRSGNDPMTTLTASGAHSTHNATPGRLKGLWGRSVRFVDTYMEEA
ncbi:MAG: minor capsid protein [Chloroflexi bacterium]|nr:minor capsid protein [Chloroflexota bacterium]